MRPRFLSPAPATARDGEGGPQTAAPPAPAPRRARLSLAQQVGLALVSLTLLTTAGAAALSLWSTRSVLQAAATQRNEANAHAIAAALVQIGDAPEAAQQFLATQWATGAWRSLRYETSGEAPVFARAVLAAPGAAPAWFVQALGVMPGKTSAAVIREGRALGHVELQADAAADDTLLWEAASATTVMLAGLGMLAALLALAMLVRMRSAIAPALDQARVLALGRCVTAAEPAAPEMQVLTRAMNTMVNRLKSAVDLQVAQVEQLRRQAHLDPLTGLSNRRHFLARLDAALAREDGTAQCGLLLLRLRDLAESNRTLGHAATDRMIAALGQVLATYAERVPGCIPGRLNGADFALCLPVGGMAQETALSLAQALRTVLPTIGPGVTAALGGVELQHGVAQADAMARADEALARAELRGPFAVEVLALGRGQSTGLGESGWRKGLDTALAAGCVALAEFPLVDSQGVLVHLEAPLRLQLKPGGSYEPAALWLPLATRTRMTGAVDGCAVTLALDAIVRDGRPRNVNLAPASLADGEFVSRLRAMLFARARAARHLSIEIDEAAAVERFAHLRELARLVRPCGVRIGLEHAGQHLATIDHLFEDWLDFVKLDASLGSGAAKDAQRAGFVRAAVGLLHGLAIDVYAEGIREDDDASALWDCGVDGITGPWATARFSHRL